MLATVPLLVLLIQDPPAAPTAPAPTLESVVASASQLHAALEVGVLRPQYAELLQKHLPVAIAYVKSPPPDTHPDVVAAVDQAVNRYRAALGSWNLANMYWARARQALDLAQLAAKEDPARRESPEVIKITAGAEVSGRLGFGDFVEGGALGGHYMDRFDVAIAQPGKYHLQAPGTTCDPEPIASEANGKLIRNWETTYSPAGRIYKLKPGAYRVTISCPFETGPGVTQYKLQVAPVK